MSAQKLSMTFTSVVISGGAIKVVSAVGCVKYLEEQGLCEKLVNYVGTSAGAILCFFLVLGYSSSEIIEHLRNIFESEIVTNMINIDKVLEMDMSMGISDGTSLIKLFQSILQKKTNKIDITFIDIAKKYGKNLVVCVSNLTEERAEFLSVDNVPDMSALDALRMSCSIPLLFTPMKWKQSMYVDGGLYCNFPISYFTSDVSQSKEIRNVLGINICSDNSVENIQGTISYVLFIIRSLLTKYNETQMSLILPEDDINKNIVTINVKEVSWLSFDQMRMVLPDDVLEEHIQHGYEVIKKHFESIQPSVRLQNILA